MEIFPRIPLRRLVFKIVQSKHDFFSSLLNLFATRITDTGLKELEMLPQLRSLYVWQTGVTPAAFAEHQTDRRRIARWKNEINQLEREIAREEFSGNFGELLPPRSI